MNELANWVKLGGNWWAFGSWIASTTILLLLSVNLVADWLNGHKWWRRSI